MSGTPTPLVGTEDLIARFQWPEYVVFGAMLAISAGIGIFYGCFTGKQTTSEFLMGNRQMGLIPMSMSLLASFLSAITLLGTPVEMYRYGTQYWVAGISNFAAMASAAYLYMPVFYNLQVTSAYEYLEIRFHKSVRLLGSVIFIVQMSIYMSIVVYAPSLAMSQVTGMNVYAAVVAMFVVCTFYTALGGMKAVMWTDTFQVVIIFASMLVVFIKGAMDVGGPSAVWEIAANGSRIEFFNFDFDPRTRHTVWSLVIGGYFTWLCIYGVNQAQVQRYLTVPKIQKAQRAIWINSIALVSILCICCFGGLVIYARYSTCDPLTAKRIKTLDQLLPLFVMETLGNIPGLPGFFVAGIFSGALSSVSSGLNSLAAICLEDFVKAVYTELSDEKSTQISKILAVGFGVISFALVFVAENLGGVLQAAFSILGMTGGPLLGVFSLGMFFPWANSLGAFVGTLSSLTFIFWLGFGANIEIYSGNLVFPKLPVSIHGCPEALNVTLPVPNPGLSGGLLEFYRVSYIWYSFIGAAMTIVIGLLISFLTKAQDPQELDPKLISPPIDRFVRWLFPEYRHKIGWDMGANIKPPKRRTSKPSLQNGDQSIHDLPSVKSFNYLKNEEVLSESLDSFI